MNSFRRLLESLSQKTVSTAQKGQIFERIVKAFLEQDRAQAERYDAVWLWSDWPGNQNQHDTGIDLVARERHSGDLVAIISRANKNFRLWGSLASLKLNGTASSPMSIEIGSINGLAPTKV